MTKALARQEQVDRAPAEVRADTRFNDLVHSLVVITMAHVIVGTTPGLIGPGVRGARRGGGGLVCGAAYGPAGRAMAVPGMMKIIAVRVVSDAVHRGMFRVEYPDGLLSDMVKLSRANDAMADYREVVDGEGRRYDRIALQALLAALDASDRQLRRDDCGDWAIFGRIGHVYADGAGWHLAVYPGGTSRRWTNARRRLALFATVTVDCDDEGTVRRDRLPTTEEAAEVRDVLGIRKQRHLSAEDLARLRLQFAPLQKPGSGAQIDETEVPAIQGPAPS
jgi:hypothetical protein